MDAKSSYLLGQAHGLQHGAKNVHNMDISLEAAILLLIAEQLSTLSERLYEVRELVRMQRP